MKTKLFILTGCLSALSVITSCDDDHHFTPENTVVNAFNLQYPNAERVEWETKAGFKVADFILNTHQTEAWFDYDGSWLLTETDLTFNELPAEVQKSFNESPYQSWHIDDVDQLERVNAALIYVIEVEQGKEEYDLYYSEEGTLIKEVNDHTNAEHIPVVIPGTIIDEIKRMYPNAVIRDIDKKGTFFEFEIQDGHIERELLFNSEQKWVSTTWDIRQADVPAIVLETLKQSQYNNYKIDDIEAMQKPEGMYYIFELESGNKEIYLTIDATGTIII
ncbi:PepSY-like domain-containing protein [Parabacteroides sp. PF5-9]|uniref:PepSY-like domain-containing protein n=1 Tax=Parabacteroides sp. PF5-9 TaxID=1742404 RepID=UPI002474E51D|nr:PepSY-like domain-containing protein [Parabacteroides sp. PF5-9]MDH6358579.1 hypothetical protein [Parabacteroides sp. PF5-9]